MILVRERSGPPRHIKKLSNVIFIINISAHNLKKWHLAFKSKINLIMVVWYYYTYSMKQKSNFDSGHTLVVISSKNTCLPSIVQILLINFTPAGKQHYPITQMQKL